MKYLSIHIIVLLAVSINTVKGQWEIGCDASLFLSKYTTYDPGRIFKPRFSVPTGVIGLTMGYRVNERDLWVDSGIAYRELNPAFSTETDPIHGYSTINGISLLTIPILLRQDLTALIAPTRKKRYSLSLKAGIISCLSMRQGILKGGLSSQDAFTYWEAKSEVKRFFTPIATVGVELRFSIIKAKLYGLIQTQYWWGSNKILQSNIVYKQSNSNTTKYAYITNSGAGHSPFGIGLRYQL